MTATLDLSRARPAGAPAALNLAGLTRGEIATAMVEAGIAAPAQAKMRANQIWGWTQHHGATSFDAMSNIAKDTRGALSERFTLARPEIAERQQSVDGTIKWRVSPSRCRWSSRCAAPRILKQPDGARNSHFA